MIPALSLTSKGVLGKKITLCFSITIYKMRGLVKMSDLKNTYAVEFSIQIQFYVEF